MATPKEGLCRTCKEVHPLTYRNLCQKCTTDYERAYAESNRDRLNENSRRWRKENRHLYLGRVANQRKEKIKNMTPEQLIEFRAKEKVHAMAEMARLKKIVFDHYGWQCACCGEKEVLFLTVDHILNDGAEKRKVEGQSYSAYRWIIKNGFPDHLQILCRNCNWGKYLNGGTCPHKQPLTTIPGAGVEPSGSKRHTP